MNFFSSFDRIFLWTLQYLFPITGPPLNLHLNFAAMLDNGPVNALRPAPTKRPGAKGLLSMLSVDFSRNRTVSMRRPLRKLLVTFLLGVLCWHKANAQLPLPETPSPVLATLEGTVTDPDGDAIIGAQVRLSGDAIPVPRETVTDDEGCFHFPNVPPGPFRVDAISQGFLTSRFSGALLAGQQMELPEIALPVAGIKSDVQVTLTLHEEAEAEMKDEETQRIAGFLPNFYVTYNWHAAPMSTSQKYRFALRTLIDPVNLGLNGVIAGVQQATNALPGYGQDAQGYAKRFGADTADFFIGATLGGAILPSIFHQDPRYFYMGKERGGIPKRILYALATSVICRGDNGRWQPNYSSVLGDLGAGAATNLYYPEGNRNGTAITFENGGLSIVSDAINNVIQELFFRQLTPHAPTYAPVKTP